MKRPRGTVRQLHDPLGVGLPLPGVRPVAAHALLDPPRRLHPPRPAQPVLGRVDLQGEIRSRREAQRLPQRGLRTFDDLDRRAARRGVRRQLGLDFIDPGANAVELEEAVRTDVGFDRRSLDLVDDARIEPPCGFERTQADPATTGIDRRAVVGRHPSRDRRAQAQSNRSEIENPPRGHFRLPAIGRSVGCERETQVVGRRGKLAPETTGRIDRAGDLTLRWFPASRHTARRKRGDEELGRRKGLRIRTFQNADQLPERPKRELRLAARARRTEGHGLSPNPVAGHRSGNLSLRTRRTAHSRPSPGDRHRRKLAFRSLLSQSKLARQLSWSLDRKARLGRQLEIDAGRTGGREERGDKQWK